jgi:hypothetical protein
VTNEERLAPTRSRDYLVIFSVTVTSVFLLAFVFMAAVMLLVAREHAFAERANQRCAASAPDGATGWTLDYGTGRTFTCVYNRNGRRTGKTLRFRL